MEHDNFTDASADKHMGEKFNSQICQRIVVSKKCKQEVFDGLLAGKNVVVDNTSVDAIIDQFIKRLPTLWEQNTFRLL